MASYQKRGKTWQYTISRMVNGKSKPIRKGGFRTKGEAVAEASEIESKLKRGINLHLKPIPFADYFGQWIKMYKSNVARVTMDRYLNSLEVVENHFYDTAIQNINKRDYQTFLNEYSKDRAKATVQKLNSHIRACVRDSIDEGIISVDFTRNVSVGGKEGKRSSEKHLNYEDSQKLMKEVFNSLDVSLTYYLILLALTSGMRFGELVGLKRSDFNFFNNTISIERTWGYKKSQGGGFYPTKNKQSERIIKMDKKTMTAFRRLFDKTPDNIHKLVFYSPTSKYKSITNTAANKLLKGVLKKLKTDKISMHGLRHTHASVLLYKKVSIHYVSERLGHADIETTLREYTHVIKELRVEDEKRATEVYEQINV